MRYPIVSIIGSLKFKDDIDKCARELHKTHVVFTPWLPLVRDNYTEDEVSTDTLDKLGAQRIDMSDFVCLVAPTGYYGDSTRKEIRYAVKKGKRVELLLAYPKQGGDVDGFLNTYSILQIKLKSDGVLLEDTEKVATRLRTMGILK
jgi:hypothetical protein